MLQVRIQAPYNKFPETTSFGAMPPHSQEIAQLMVDARQTIIVVPNSALKGILVVPEDEWCYVGLPLKI